jgi:2-polyprenyl-3-methyl-5-hydroxy-6-metoxy-1,4-benzoquinol methylase
MINRLHARLHRPESGWDPVPSDHAAGYAAGEWRQISDEVLDEIGVWLNGFEGRRVLDLGGGPGQYSVAFAKRGARVTWHDISRRYLEIARNKALQAGVADRITFSLGYLDEAPSLLGERFDLVFNRICFNYGFGDRAFAQVVFKLVGPGGVGYVDTTHSGYKRSEMSTVARLRTWLNDHLAIKIGHPYPPHGRLARLFGGMPVQRLLADYRAGFNDRILFQKSGGAG